MQWSRYHANPRTSYYLFLRRVYEMTAQEALQYVNRVGTPPTAGEIRKALRPRDFYTV